MDPIKLKKLYNPTSETLQFQFNSALYILEAGENAGFVDYIAVHGAKKLADKNIKTNNPDEHRLLMEVYLENSTPELTAKKLGINLEKIQQEALEKNKGKARMMNLENQVVEQNKKINFLTSKMEELLSVKAKVKEEIKGKKTK